MTRLMKWLAGDNAKVEKQMIEAENNLAAAEKQTEETIATLNGEGEWFLRLEKSQRRKTLDDLDEKLDSAKDEIIRKVETTCAGMT